LIGGDGSRVRLSQARQKEVSIYVQRCGITAFLPLS
jgi:hypothetical protein